jgi:hypothetical protein
MDDLLDYEDAPIVEAEVEDTKEKKGTGISSFF